MCRPPADVSFSTDELDALLQALQRFAIARDWPDEKMVGALYVVLEHMKREFGVVSMGPAQPIPDNN